MVITLTTEVVTIKFVCKLSRVYVWAAVLKLYNTSSTALEFDRQEQ